MIVQKNQIFQRKRWMALITKVFALILGITLTLPTFCATAAPSAIEESWQLVNPPYGQFDLNFYNGSDAGKMACNSYFGNYQALPGVPCFGEYPITFGPQTITYAECAEVPLESKYLKQLQSVRDYKVCQDKLTLYTGYGETLQYTKIGD